jgi:hypothetical protein
MQAYNTVLPVVFYGYEIYTLTLRKSIHCRMLENNMLKRVFGLKGIGNDTR